MSSPISRALTGHHPHHHATQRHATPRHPSGACACSALHTAAPQHHCTTAPPHHCTSQNTPHHSTLLHSTPHHITSHHTTPHHSTLLHSTAQHSTSNHTAIQHTTSKKKQKSTTNKIKSHATRCHHMPSPARCTCSVQAHHIAATCRNSRGACAGTHQAHVQAQHVTLSEKGLLAARHGVAIPLRLGSAGLPCPDQHTHAESPVGGGRV